MRLVRCDMGSGGWSLHTEHSGEWVCVADGPSGWNAAAEDWARPDDQDWGFAANQAERLARGEITRFEAERAACRLEASS